METELKTDLEFDLVGKPVLVTTIHRGVFAGILVERKGDQVALQHAQMAVYWSKDCHGALGLAAHGPSCKCRIGPPALSAELRGVSAIIEISDDAWAKWREQPWSD